MSILIQRTEDGSETCFNETYGQAYHSKHGAYREAIEKHVLACKIPELATSQSQLRILDLCFGLGYNSFAAIDEAQKINPNISFEIIGLENDESILEKIPLIKFPDSLKRFQTHNWKNEPRFSNYIEIKVILGDARLSIKNLEKDFFDAVFFDPFSPSVCPELWTEEFIKDVVHTAKPGAYISTYSCARLVKDNFKSAACELFEGPKAGRRNGGVLARKL